jgi:hypothetical protein
MSAQSLIHIFTNLVPTSSFLIKHRWPEIGGCLENAEFSKNEKLLKYVTSSISPDAFDGLSGVNTKLTFYQYLFSFSTLEVDIQQT